MAYILPTWKSPEVDMVDGTPVLAVEAKGGPTVQVGPLNPGREVRVPGERAGSREDCP